MYQGKNSISQVPLNDRIKLAAQPSSQVQIQDGVTVSTPTEEEINLFRQDAEMLFDAMEADKAMVDTQIDDVAKKVDKYIDLFIDLSNHSIKSTNQSSKSTKSKQNNQPKIKNQIKNQINQSNQSIKSINQI